MTLAGCSLTCCRHRSSGTAQSSSIARPAVSVHAWPCGKSATGQQAVPVMFHLRWFKREP
jgi:hypothetical protein